MDEAGRLVDELQRKLVELDRRVWSYRRDMASEFTKYARSLLHQVPKDVSDEVSRSIAASLKEYRSLNPDNDLVIDLSSSPTSPPQSSIPGADLSHEKDTSEHGADVNASPVTATPWQIPQQAQEQQQRSHLGEEPLARSPHEREKEFHGLFTPTYLPLLDASASAIPRRSSYDSYLADKDNESREKESGPSSTATMYSNVNESTSAPALLPSTTLPALATDVAPEKLRPVTPQRQGTDEVSVSSDDSRGPVRRSALRRSSSGSTTKNQSPRRVRFELEGQEVLPTVEPLIPEVTSDLRSPTVSIDDDDLFNGSMLEMIEDVDEPEPPKRVSSSQALRALSRAPLEDDGTTWTTVTSPPEEMEAAEAELFEDDEEAPGGISVGNRHGDFTSTPDSVPLNMPTLHTGTSSEMLNTDSLENGRGGNDLNNDLVDPSSGRHHSEGDALLRQPLSGSEIGDSTSPALSSSQQAERPNNEVREVTSRSNYDDDEDLFRFDEESNAIPPLSEEPDPEPESPEIPEVEDEHVNLSQYSQSPAKPIVRTILGKSTAVPSRGVVGSYKGHPFSIPIVSDEIHAQAASLGAIHSFVGSVSGATGLDEADLKSFRATGAASFSGAPKSLSERMMMEELLEAPEEPA